MRTRPSRITGIEPESYLRVIALADKIVAGKRTSATSDIVIGTELASDLGADARRQAAVDARPSGAAETLTVTGIFDFGNKGVNERNVYIALRAAQNLLDLAGGVSSIELNVRDPFEAEDIAQTIAGRDRSRGRQLDQDQRAVLYRDFGADARPTR